MQSVNCVSVKGTVARQIEGRTVPKTAKSRQGITPFSRNTNRLQNTKRDIRDVLICKSGIEYRVKYALVVSIVSICQCSRELPWLRIVLWRERFRLSKSNSTAWRNCAANRPR